MLEIALNLYGRAHNSPVPRRHCCRAPPEQPPHSRLLTALPCSEGLSVFGVPSEIHEDSQAASDIEEGKGLVPCWGDEQDLADRWDAR
jgi:hypothetical protein